MFQFLLFYARAACTMAYRAQTHTHTHDCVRMSKRFRCLVSCTFFRLFVASLSTDHIRMPPALLKQFKMHGTNHHVRAALGRSPNGTNEWRERIFFNFSKPNGVFLEGSRCVQRRTLIKCTNNVWMAFLAVVWLMSVSPASLPGP